MNKNNTQLNKPTIIAILLFAALFVLLMIVALVAQNSKQATTADEVAGTTKVDPVSGETIAVDSHQSQTGAGSPNSDRPTMLGFGKLADYGVSANQRAKISEQLTAFAKQQDPKITHMSFYKDSYRQQLPDDSGVAHMTFMIQANKETDYYVDVAYSGTSDAAVTVYLEDKKTLIFTQ